ncbi:MAG: hypothetical protein KF764_17020 [Labilithrix sp.]|nr:hypothetical protein [Labilithrix sp.]MBX3223379.1 hypothetical protein [Labilithrix sp.]
MSFSLAPLLIHSEAVSPGARSALRAALAAGDDQRTAMLSSAAHILHSETGLECSDVRELVGLPPDGGCG